MSEDPAVEATALAALAEKLPPGQRAQFMAMAIRLKNLPPDDEFVVALEALGFTTLILKGIPEEIAETVRKMRSGLDDAQREGLRADIEEVLLRSIDTPSYKDLRGLVSEMKEQQRWFRQQGDGLLASLSQTKRWLEKHHAIVPSLALGLTASVFGGAIVLGASLLYFGIDLSHGRRALAAPSSLPPHIEAATDYYELDLPEFGGRVGVIRVTGDVMTVYQDGAKGFVVVEAGTLNR